MVQTGHPVPTTVTPARRAKVSDGRSVTVAVPTGGVEAGLFYLIGGFFGAAFTTVTAAQVAAAGAGVLQVALNIEQAEYDTVAAQLAAVTFVAGQLVYWDPVAFRITNVATNNRLIGRCTRIAPVVSFVLAGVVA